MSQLPKNDLLQGKKLVEAQVFKRALEDAIAIETVWAESISAEEYQASKEAGDSELDWLKAFGLVQRANLDYFNVEGFEGKDNNPTETSIIELSEQEQSELGNALLKGVPVPSGGLVSLSLAQNATPKEWFSGIYGRALVARFISFAKAGEYWLIKQQRG